VPDRIRRNYKAAVPQLYRGDVQFLLPLNLAGSGGRTWRWWSSDRKTEVATGRTQ
jgi:hypothetical protein